MVAVNGSRSRVFAKEVRRRRIFWGGEHAGTGMGWERRRWGGGKQIELYSLVLSKRCLACGTHNLSLCRGIW